MSTAIPVGLCQCGCGELTPIATRSYLGRGVIKGRPARFVNAGHATRKAANEHYRVEDRGYKTSCWVWQLSTDRDGYGNLWARGTSQKAHRVYYEDHVGPVPKGLQLDHLCRVRSCVNPEHLEPVTAQVNVLRGISPAAVNATRTSCPAGHPYDDENTKILARGWRRCRTCERQRSAA